MKTLASTRKRRNNAARDAKLPPNKKPALQMQVLSSDTQPTHQATIPQKRSKCAKKDGFVIQVAIDVGTTYTRATYTRMRDKLSQDPRSEREFMVNTIKNTDLNKKDMVPTVCARHIPSDTVYFGDEAEDRLEKAQFADQDHDWEMLRYIKLFFCDFKTTTRLRDEDQVGIGFQVLQAHREKVRSWCNATGHELEPWTLMSDFLKHFWEKYVEPQLLERYGRNNPDWKYYPIYVVLTRSSLWSFRVDDDFYQAAEKAFGSRVQSIALFDEATAAMCGTFIKLETFSSITLHEAELVLDLGGGTADCCVVIYTRAVPLQIAEVVPPLGGPYGGAVVVEAFRGVLEEKIKSAYLSFSNDEDRLDGWPLIRDHLLQGFDKAMQSFRGAHDYESGDTEMSIPAYNFNGTTTAELRIAGYRCSPKHLHIQHTEVERLFSFCLEGISDIVKEQHRVAPDAIEKRNKPRKHPFVPPEVRSIHVVGGFSLCPYVKDQLGQLLGSLVDPGRIHFTHATIDTPIVATGALYYGVSDDFVESRVLRTNIGLVQRIVWLEEYEPRPQGIDIDTSPLTGEQIAYDMIRVLWYKDERVGQDDFRKFRGTYWIPDTGTFKMQEALCCINKLKKRYGKDIEVEDQLVHYIAESDESREVLGIDQIGLLQTTIGDLETRAWTRQEDSRKEVGMKEGDVNEKTYWLVDYELYSIFEGLRHKIVVRLPNSGHFDCEEADCPGADGGVCPGKRTSSADKGYVEFELTIKAGHTLGNESN